MELVCFENVKLLVRSRYVKCLKPAVEKRRGEDVSVFLSNHLAFGRLECDIKKIFNALGFRVFVSYLTKAEKKVIWISRYLYDLLIS